MPTSLYNNQSMKERRRFLRKNQTEWENILWSELRGKKLDGYKFLRQYSVGPYILDFYCSRLRLAIEVDGKQHAEEDGASHDQEREKFLNEQKIHTIRFKNSDITNGLDNVLREIRKEANIRAADPSLVILRVSSK